MKKPLSLSLVLHGLLCLLMVGSLPQGCGTGSGDDKEEHSEAQKRSAEGSDNTTLSESEGEKQDTVSIDILSREEAEAIIREIKCDKWFGGIGISHDYFNVVHEAPEWYPAYQAGIRVDDRILSKVTRGEVGSLLNVIVSRHGSVLTFNVKRGKICYEEKEQ